MEIKMMKIGEITPYEKNPRINDKAVDAVCKSLQEFGWQQPIVVDKNHVIIIGHTRTKAAQKLGWTEVPVVVAENLSPEQVKALRIADNKTGEIAEWDYNLLPAELQDLCSAGYDATLTGFSLEDIGDILAGEDTPADGATDPDAVPEPPKEANSKPGTVYQLGNHRLICGDSTKNEDVQKVMAGEQANLWLTDPPYNVAYEGSDGQTIQNDNMEDAKFREFLTTAFKCAHEAMTPGASFYIFHADSEGFNFRAACHDTGLKVRQCLIWKKDSLVLGRQDYHWIHEPCQPKGTLVRTPHGDVPIETLKDGDRVISFNSYSGQVTGYRDGIPIKVGSRHYEGEMYAVSSDGHTTRVTDNHLFSVRFNAKDSHRYCTYLMRRGKWWRIGHTRAYDARQFGLKSRFSQEKAEEAWLLDVYESRSDAQVGEQTLAVKYGIPYTHWEIERGQKLRQSAFRTAEQVQDIYDSLDLNELQQNAKRLLEAYGRSLKYPLLTAETMREKFSTRVTAKIRACNLVPGIMQLPIPLKSYDGVKSFNWVSIERVTHEPFSGCVYSLAVEPYHHYIADGIVTHNCLTGWKDGAGHHWYGDRKQTTVMEFAKPKKNGDHPTMKPVEMLEYLLKNSSKRGDIVLDTFGGSGSTLMACERLDRKARLVELDPKYCDVIRRRWAEFRYGEGCDWVAKTPEVKEEK